MGGGDNITNALSMVVAILFDKAGGKCTCLRCLSVCLCARLLKNVCMDLDEILRVDKCLDMYELINI